MLRVALLLLLQSVPNLADTDHMLALEADLSALRGVMDGWTEAADPEAGLEPEQLDEQREEEEKEEEESSQNWQGGGGWVSSRLLPWGGLSKPTWSKTPPGSGDAGKKKPSGEICSSTPEGKAKGVKCDGCKAFGDSCGIDNGEGDDSITKGNSKCYTYCKKGKDLEEEQKKAFDKDVKMKEAKQREDFGAFFKDKWKNKGQASPAPSPVAFEGMGEGADPGLHGGGASPPPVEGMGEGAMGPPAAKEDECGPTSEMHQLKVGMGLAGPPKPHCQKKKKIQEKLAEGDGDMQKNNPCKCTPHQFCDFSKPDKGKGTCMVCPDMQIHLPKAKEGEEWCTDPETILPIEGHADCVKRCFTPGKRYFWPKGSQENGAMVQKCEECNSGTCQRVKSNAHNNPGLQPKGDEKMQCTPGPLGGLRRNADKKEEDAPIE